MYGQVVDTDGHETGMFEVPAGGRRYRALELLVKQKRMAKIRLSSPALSVTVGSPRMIPSLRMTNASACIRLISSGRSSVYVTAR